LCCSCLFLLQRLIFLIIEDLMIINCLMLMSCFLPVQQVEVEEGAGSALLPFRTTPDLPQDARVEWTYYTPDQEYICVHVYEKESAQLGEQDDRYKNRTKMNEDPWTTGDCSLTLNDLQQDNSGRYVCEVIRHGVLLRMKTVVLKVKGQSSVAGQRSGVSLCCVSSADRSQITYQFPPVREDAEAEAIVNVIPDVILSIFLGNKLHVIMESKSLFCSGSNWTIKLYDQCIQNVFICHESIYLFQGTNCREEEEKKKKEEVEEEKKEEVEEEKKEELFCVFFCPSDFCELTLDPNTANERLKLSENNKKGEGVEEVQSYPDHQDRFEVCPQLMCSTGLTGRCYWEVQWSGNVEISVTYRGIRRKGDSLDCRFGENDQSWSLNCDAGGYRAWHKNECTVLLQSSSSSSSSSSSGTVSVYVDCPAGSVSFYEVSSDKLIHLHTFKTTLTEPLFGGFGLWSPGSTVCLSSLHRSYHPDKHRRSSSLHVKLL
uniref:B30.2/SPRY domain-containing protein n=1 Tax=Sphaeramia orbicularis TaxID=375764 RepID=A0A673C6G2_9TELE